LGKPNRRGLAVITGAPPVNPEQLAPVPSHETEMAVSVTKIVVSALAGVANIANAPSARPATDVLIFIPITLFIDTSSAF
jgi:hypothetical protein